MSDPPSNGSAAASGNNRAPVLRLGLVCVTVYLFLVGLPLIKGVPLVIGIFAGSLILAGLSLLLVGLGASIPTTARTEAVLGLALLAAWLGLNQIPGKDPALRLYVGPVGTLAFILTCLFVGKLLARIVRERALAFPVVLVAALADVFTVFWGPTGQALERAPALVQKLSLAIPAAGSAAGAEGARGLAFVASMGLGDFIFLAFFLTIAVRFGFPLVRTMVAVILGACIGIILALANPFGLPGMPLLPWMSAAFLLVNARNFHLSPIEKRDTAIAIGLLAALFVVAALALRSQ
ncbi:MAG: hypothetical protein KBI47_15735 [Armatimonadetes bacterium]|jgi:hypothetical protein|nr:hypothetical protein [Armatimonadota bacterium]MDI9586542.1 hypothetical protein [Acidobacteriota bacterium]